MKKNFGFSLDIFLVESVDKEREKDGRSRSSMMNKILMERYGAK